VSWPPKPGADIMRLSDEELVAGIVIIRDGPRVATRLTDWEQTFVEGLPNAWYRHGSITWQQRKSARGLLRKIHDRLARRASVRALAEQPPAEPYYEDDDR